MKISKIIIFVALFSLVSIAYVVSSALAAKELPEQTVGCLKSVANEKDTATAKAKEVYALKKKVIEDAYKTNSQAATALPKNSERRKALKLAKRERQNNLKVARKILDQSISNIKREFKSGQKTCKKVSEKPSETKFSFNREAVPYTNPENNRGCVKNSSPVFTHEFTDLSLIDSIAPIGGINVGSSSRSYIAIKKDASGNWPMVPLYAPANATLQAIYYAKRNYPSGARGEYRLEFQVSCEVKFVFDHIANVSDKIKALAPQTPADNSHTGGYVSLPVEAGELLGSTNGTGMAGTWDFYVLTTAQPLYHVNPSRWQSEHNKYAACPYDYFTPELKNKYYNALATWEGTKIDPPNCGQASHDVAGTLAGGWFLENSTDMRGSSLLVASNFNLVEVLFIRPDPSQTLLDQLRFGFRAHTFSVRPEALKPGDSVCYADDGKYAYFSLVSDTELRSASGAGSCPASLPDEYETWRR